MITQLALRWRERRGSFKVQSSTIETRHCEVAPLEQSEAKAFVVRHHYSGTYPAARFRFGLYRFNRLEGVAVFSVPVNDKAITSCLPGQAIESVELGRLVLLDPVPFDGESWFIGRCFEHLKREGLVGVISLSDPQPRTTAAGHAIFAGHIGQIYQATNGIYLGRATARTVLLLPDGRVFNERALSKIRARHRGWRYAAAQLEAHGAAPLGEHDDTRAWLDEWLPKLTRPLRHRGNHKYVWGLQRWSKRRLPSPNPSDYPKFPDEGRK